MKVHRFLEEYTQKPSSLFIRLYVLFFFGYLPFMILQAILNIAGVWPVNFNGEQIYGLTAIVVLACFSPFVALAFTVLTYIGLMCGYFVLRGLKYLMGNGEKSIANKT